MRALRQVVLDGGSWETAGLFLPRKDPCTPKRFAATEQDLETIVNYKEALKKVSGTGKGNHTDADGDAGAGATGKEKTGRKGEKGGEKGDGK